MPLVSMTTMLDAARREGYAVGYFESWNLESLHAVVGAAEEARSPVIIGFNAGFMTSPERVLAPENFEYYGAIGVIAAKSAAVPVALILNEIPAVDMALQGIECGFNVLMIEDETEDLEESIALTRKVVRAAHPVGVAVEAKVGHMPIAVDGAMSADQVGQSFTDPDEAKRFVEATGVDALGVSVGNIEVLMKGKVEMRLELLERIAAEVEVHLVLHGGSGIADEIVGKLVRCGVTKMNLGTVLNDSFFKGMNRVLESNQGYVSPKDLLGSGLKADIFAGGLLAMKETVKQKMKVYGSTGKATE